MAQYYDYLVIGGGSAGVRSARMAANMGAKALLIEGKNLGGTCVNVGCVPKKIFSYAANFKREIDIATGYGWQINKKDFLWSDFISKKNTEIQRLNQIYADLLNKAGVEVISGFAQFNSQGNVEVLGQTYQAKYILIASGGMPNKLGISGEDLAITSDQVFFLNQCPQKILIVGGGYIAAEFASIFNNFGSQVDLSYRGDLFLKSFDIDLRIKLKNEMSKQGVNFLWNSNLKSLTKVGIKIQASFVDGQVAEYDQVLLATGRTPNLNSLNIHNTKIQLNNNGSIKVDDNLQTTHHNIFAAGDVISKISLTPVAIKQGSYLASYLFGDRQARVVDYDKVPTAVFTSPNLATVGMTEATAKQQAIEVKIYKSFFSPMRTLFAGDDTKFFIKMIVEAESETVLGVHLMGEDAPEILQGFAVAVSLKAKKHELDQVIGIHPTLAEEIVTMR